MGEARRRRELGLAPRVIVPTLYHFTSPHHVDGCRRHGLVRGMLPLELGAPGRRARVRRGFQWLTVNPDREQSWVQDSSLPYDRCAFRLTVRVPPTRARRLFRWLDVGERLVGPEMFATLNGDGDPENWFVFVGHLLPHWITRVEDVRPVAEPEPAA